MLAGEEAAPVEVATAPAAAEPAPVKPPATPAKEPVKSCASPAADETQSEEAAPDPATEGVALLEDVAQKVQVASTSCHEYLLHACLARHTCARAHVYTGRLGPWLHFNWWEGRACPAGFRSHALLATVDGERCWVWPKPDRDLRF